MNSEQIQALASSYSSHTGLKVSTLGVYAVNDGKFFLRLIGGYDCRTKTAQKVAEWFSDNWPTDLEWPRDIPRPSAKQEDAA
ncbi:hypothetical protein ACLGGT_07485 [Roseovarius sp. MS2]|uniref:hypothetical protein n=1 Tax=Roseovarius sp. MS2 TaxID=3390728 RepID=UPI003EDC3EA9